MLSEAQLLELVEGQYTEAERDIVVELARECLALRAEVARLREQLNQACLDRDGARIRTAGCGCLHDPHCPCLAALTDPATVERLLLVPWEFWRAQARAALAALGEAPRGGA